ncbi:unnamed protein product [Rhizophagus irregularis]|nr:unnamed protein product [Rhizophagus irregularis]
MFVHEYFHRASKDWNIRDFLEECDLEHFDLDRQVAKNWNSERSRNRVYLHQPTITGENINGFVNINKNGIFASGSTISKRDREEDERKDRAKKSKIDLKIDEFFFPVHSSHDQAHENVNNNYDDEEPNTTFEPQDTTISSATEARKLIKEHWDNVISTIERFLTSNPDTTQLDSASASVSSSSDRGTDQDTEQDTYQDTKQDGNAKEVEQYLTKISKEVNNAKKLREVVKKERAKLRTNDNVKWKRRALELMKILGEKTLHCSAILLNQPLKDDDRRCASNKIDAIISILELDLEFSTLEVSGSPSYQLPRRFRKAFRYMITTFMSIACVCPSQVFIIFKQESKFSYPAITFLVFKDLPIFASNLWIMRNMIISSTKNILAYVTSAPTEFGNDEAVIDKDFTQEKKE